MNNRATDTSRKSSFVDPDVAERASAQDAAWFVCHPGRRCRFRRMQTGELPAPNGEQWILVGQAFPGLRMRFAVRIDGYGWDVPKNDAELLKLHQLFLHGQPAVIVGGRVIPADEVHEGDGRVH